MNTSRYSMGCFEGDKQQRYYLYERGRQIDHIPYSKDEAKAKLAQLRKQERKEAQA